MAGARVVVGLALAVRVGRRVVLVPSPCDVVVDFNRAQLDVGRVIYVVEFTRVVVAVVVVGIFDVGRVLDRFLCRVGPLQIIVLC